MSMEDILERILYASNDVDHYPDPDGKYPVCKPALRSNKCERCGSPVDDVDGACPAVPPEQRWSMRLREEEEE